MIAEQINFTEEYHGYVGAVGAIYDVQGIEQRTKGKSLYEIRDFYNFSTMAIINDDIFLSGINNLKEKSQENYLRSIEILSYKNYTGIDKIYAVIGGFHEEWNPIDVIEAKIKFLEDINPEIICGMHCTGFNFNKIMERHPSHTLGIVGTEFHL